MIQTLFVQSVWAALFAAACLLTLPVDSLAQTDSPAEHFPLSVLPPAWAYPVNPPNMPEDLEQFEHRDARSRFVAYAPVGSVKAGGALVKMGGPNRTLACASCHGEDLKGAGIVPSIAGRSPSYIVRQLFDIQSGLHVGTDVAPMEEVVKQLRVEDMISIAAFLATLR
jgi:cytochrome c553